MKMNLWKKNILLLILTCCLSSSLVGLETINHVNIQKKKVGDVELAYYIRGKGEPLLMIMGFRGTMGIWDPGLLSELEKKFTLILFDNRGAGLSSDTDNDLTSISNMAEDTFNFIKTLGYQKVHVLGWSMGSEIGQQLAIEHPEVVKTLILCAPNAGGKHVSARPAEVSDKLYSSNISREQGLSLIFPETSEGRKASASFVTRLIDSIARGDTPDDLTVSNQTLERQKHALSLWYKNDTNYTALSRLKVPTLVTGGLEDILDKPENVKMVANQIPFAWSAFFPGAGHAFLFQDYSKFSQLVTLFIETMNDGLKRSEENK